MSDAMRLTFWRKIPSGRVGAYRAELEAEGFQETPEGNGYTVYAHPDGREVRLEQVSQRRVQTSGWAPLGGS